LASHYEKVAGTIDWYCLDYWAEQTKLPIQALKREVQHLISLRCDAHDFMVALRESGREIILVTNAHPDSLLLKIELTQLDKYFDVLYSTHEFGVTKESQLLWERLQEKQGFDLDNTLFVDDSIDILESAQQYGFEHLLAVENPDSQKATRTINSFPSTSDFRTLIDEIRKNPIK
jgi:HAD superfamily hydrolase (TIGR01509 family)